VLKNQTSQPPSCFGELFDKTAAECVGGFDSKWSGVGGSRVRPVCDFADSCARTVSDKQHQVIPTSSLTRPQPHTAFGNSTPSGYQRPTVPAQPTRTWEPPSQHQPQQQQRYATQPYQHPSHFSGHYGIPAYLSVRQPSNSGTIVERMWWETLRSMGKAIGHTLANFFDSEVFGRFGGPGPGAGPSS